MLWRPLYQNASLPPVAERVRVKAGRASDNPRTPLEKTSAGGPQFVGIWLFPVMPASPDTFTRSAKKGVVRLVCCVYCPRGRIVKNWLKRRDQVTLASTTEFRDSSSNPNREVLSLAVR